MKSRSRRVLTTTDIIDGWSVRIKRHAGVPRGEAITFVAADDESSLGRAFFRKHADARRFVKELREHHLDGFVVRARVILKTAV